MVCRQLTKKKYENFTQQLIQKAWQEPLDSSFSITMTVDDSEYILDSVDTSVKRSSFGGFSAMFHQISLP